MDAPLITAQLVTAQLIDAQLIGALVDKAIPLLGGLVATWLGFRPPAGGGEGTAGAPRARSALRVVGPLLVLWSVVGAAAAVLTRAGGPDRAAVVAGMNARMPIMADAATRIDRVDDGGDKLVYRATLLGVSSADGLAPGALDPMAAAALSEVCGHAERRAFLEEMGPIRTEYSYADGPPAGGYELRAEDCAATGR